MEQVQSQILTNICSKMLAENIKASPPSLQKFIQNKICIDFTYNPKDNKRKEVL